jgi:hypothetical protein
MKTSPISIQRHLLIPILVCAVALLISAGCSRGDAAPRLSDVPGISVKAAAELQTMVDGLNNPALLPDESRVMRGWTEDDRWTQFVAMCGPDVPKSPDELRPGYHARLEFTDGVWSISFTKLTG